MNLKAALSYFLFSYCYAYGFLLLVEEVVPLTFSPCISSCPAQSFWRALKVNVWERHWYTLCRFLEAHLFICPYVPWGEGSHWRRLLRCVKLKMFNSIAHSWAIKDVSLPRTVMGAVQGRETLVNLGVTQKIDSHFGKVGVHLWKVKDGLRRWVGLGDHMAKGWPDGRGGTGQGGP